MTQLITPQASLLSSLRLNKAQLMITDTPTNIVAAHFLHSLHRLEEKERHSSWEMKRKAPLIFPETARLVLKIVWLHVKRTLWSHMRRYFSSFSLIIFVTLAETN